MSQIRISKSRKLPDAALALAVTLLLMVIVGIAFDYYYEFNDDVLMKNMLSGAYTGTPAARNIQMQFPISALISLFYRIFPKAPVYGIFLCACQYGSIAVITYRAVRVSPGRRGRILSVVISFLFFISLVLPHLVMIQYTVTVALIAAAAVFLFYTIPEHLQFKEFFKQALPALALVWLAFMIRSEMLLLMLPFIGITGLIRWDRENSERKVTLARYAMVAVVMFAGIGLIWGADRIAYGSDDWQSFLSEFDARTKLYDYQYVPDYEENTDFYKSIGLTEADVSLLKNYDYGLDHKIDGDVLQRVADQAEELRAQELTVRIKEALKEYLYRIIHFSDGAYSVLILFLYLMLLWAINARRESTFRHKLWVVTGRIGGLMLMRSVSWLYIIYGHREPDRIVHSLYIIEAVALLAMLQTELNSKLREQSYLQLMVSIVLIGSGLVILPATIIRLGQKIDDQDRINRYALAIDEYCKNNSGNFYYEDVYSTIIDGETFNEKMFEAVDNSLMNYDLIGGWAVNSPLYERKLENFGINGDVAEEILERSDIFIICDEASDMSWVTDYYSSRGISVSVKEEDTIASVYGVYSVNRAD